MLLCGLVALAVAYALSKELRNDRGWLGAVVIAGLVGAYECWTFIDTLDQGPEVPTAGVHALRAGWGVVAGLIGSLSLLAAGIGCFALRPSA